MSRAQKTALPLASSIYTPLFFGKTSLLLLLMNMHTLCIEANLKQRGTGN